MSRPITAIIHHEALAHNLAMVRSTVENSQIFAVVKANAYGHRIENVYNAFKTADGFALLDIAEAKKLRALGWEGPIILLEGVFSPQDLFDCTQYNLSFAIHNETQLKWVQQHQYPAQFDVFLKMNSGMNRLGFKPSEYISTWNQLHSNPAIKSITHMMHFSDADGERLGKPGINYQLETFEETVKDLPGKRSISNSAAILRYKLHSDYVRSGIVLYGSSPDYPKHTIHDWNLKPTMTLKSELIAIQDLQDHETIGYGSTFTTQGPMKIGIVACGYADGYQRVSPTGTPVLVNGVRTQLIGRVSMDMLAVDVTHISDAQVGSEVVLWGKSSSGTILPIDEVASASGTVGYELMCAVTSRVTFLNQP